MLLWDYVLTVDQEVAFFWGSAATWPQALYFANRYFALASVALGTFALVSTDVTSQLSVQILLVTLYLLIWSFCDIYIRYIMTTCGLTQVFLIQFILAHRVWAMYGMANWLGWLLVGLWTVTAVSAAVLLARSFRVGHTIVTSEPVPGYIACSTTEDAHPEQLWAFVIPVLVFETLIFFLALHRSMYYSRQSESLGMPLRSRILQRALSRFFNILRGYINNLYLRCADLGNCTSKF
ncbi:hypothetical protein DL96DRAFT_1706378 [Flagelloscypha sp. PMI_526]|nr:hypothetical protein DL96DRAFT_1706378 [Flagelloscypha sp. PMI_526]